MYSPPNRITLLVDFLNTIDIEARTDVLDNADSFDQWSLSRSVKPGDRSAARLFRDSLRAGSLGATRGADGIAIPVVVDDTGLPKLAPEDAAGNALVIAIELVSTGNWSRVKLCASKGCLEAFYDASRNRSRVWCDMAECGNRAKGRNHRLRNATRSKHPQ